MIRVRRLTLQLLNAWLVDQGLPATDQRYRLRLWRESPACFDACRNELRAYVAEALEDARVKLRRGFEDSLSPFADPAIDPAANYPSALHSVTLQGYLGETLGVVAVEHWGAAGHEDWQIPALLFRFHEQEFQHLEQINRRIRDGEPHDPDAATEIRPGRTGDDALAFRRDGDGLITDVLTIEAKCLRRNRNATIREAHERLATGDPLPSGIRELIELLSDYDTPAATAWQESLVKFRASGYRDAGRHDGVAYATAHIPARVGRQAWLPPQRHEVYTADRHLDGIEFQFEDLDRLIHSLYREP